MFIRKKIKYFLLQNAFLARLVTVPWWLDQAGSFLQNNGSGHLEYWSENHQVRVETSHWSTPSQILGSDWLRSC